MPLDSIAAWLSEYVKILMISLEKDDLSGAMLQWIKNALRQVVNQRGKKTFTSILFAQIGLLHMPCNTHILSSGGTSLLYEYKNGTYRFLRAIMYPM